MPMKALFIGRFQPFHMGHLLILEYIHKMYDHIIIGIGSSQYSGTMENPFSFTERKTMIVESLKEKNISNYSIVAIPDIHDPPHWVSHVLSIISDFDIVISNNELTKKLFSEQGYTVKKTQFFERQKYAGKEIRKNIINDKEWENLVPAPVVKIMKRIDGVKRIKNLND